MKTEIVEAYDHLGSIRKLFAEYAAWIGVPLDFQNYNEELVSLPGKYAKPAGRLYIAIADGEAAGCVALRSFEAGHEGGYPCEMKRLFVRDSFKGLGLGRELAQQVIHDARQIGYTHMLLDTFDFMVNAIALYKKLGFEEIGPYRYNPYDNVKYMRLALNLYATK